MLYIGKRQSYSGDSLQGRDNTVCGMEEEHSTFGFIGDSTATSTSHRISSNISYGEDEREFDNPIYGSEEKDENVYNASVFNEQVSESPPDHEFDNQIYGCEEDEADLENGYSLASACYFAIIYDTVTDNGLSKSDKKVND